MQLVEQDNAFDVLRIIAKDARDLSKADRESINSAADQLETRERELVKLHFDFLQLQQQLLAVTDQLIAARKELSTAQKWSASSGWQKVL